MPGELTAEQCKRLDDTHFRLFDAYVDRQEEMALVAVELAAGKRAERLARQELDVSDRNYRSARIVDLDAREALRRCEERPISACQKERSAVERSSRHLEKMELQLKVARFFFDAATAAVAAANAQLKDIDDRIAVLRSRIRVVVEDSNKGHCYRHFHR